MYPGAIWLPATQPHLHVLPSSSGSSRMCLGFVAASLPAVLTASPGPFQRCPFALLPNPQSPPQISVWCTENSIVVRWETICPDLLPLGRTESDMLAELPPFLNISAGYLVANHMSPSSLSLFSFLSHHNKVPLHLYYPASLNHLCV